MTKVVGKESEIQKEAMAISKDMRELYDSCKKKEVERVEADSLANIAGKNIRALAIAIADKAVMHKVARLVVDENA